MLLQVPIKEKFDPIGEHRHWCPWLIEADVTVPTSSVSSQSPPAGAIEVRFIDWMQATLHSVVLM